MATLDSDDLEAIEALIAAAIGTPTAVDGQAATFSGMLTATYDRIERNAGFDRLPIYGDDKLFDFETGEDLFVAYPSPWYDSGAGRWVVFYTSRVDGYRVIRRRDSADGKTTWQNVQTVLTVGSAGQWDDTIVQVPIVWKESTTWYMLYAGHSGNGGEVAIGLATSSDGVTWTKSASNPIISGTQDWDLAGAYHTAVPSGIMKVGSTYYVYFSSLPTPIAMRQIGVASGTDLTALTVQATPVFGDSDGVLTTQPFAGYHSAAPLNLANYYWLVVGRYGSRHGYSAFELWYSSDPLFPANNRRLAKRILATPEGTRFPNRDIQFPQFATDTVLRTTFTTAGEVRMYFTGLHDATGTVAGGSGTEYPALATCADVRRLLRATHDVVSRTQLHLPYSRWDRTASSLVDTMDAESVELAKLGTPTAVDGQAATLAGMTQAAYTRVERNAGYDRWPIYGDDKLFDFDTGETSFATFPSVVYDPVALVWRCYYITTYGGVRVIRMRTSADGKTSWSASQAIHSPPAPWTHIWTVVVWREGATDWRMVYTGSNSSGTGICYATSTDGLTWTDSPNNPVITASQVWQTSVGRYSLEVTGGIKRTADNRYFFYTASINIGFQRKIGVIWTDDFVTWTEQADPIFGDPDYSDKPEAYSGYFGGSPFYYDTAYYLLVNRYSAANKFATYELWYSNDPLFPPDGRWLAKTVLVPAEDATFPNRGLDVAAIATDTITRRTFTYASNEFRCYFGAFHATDLADGGTWYTALATKASPYEAIRGVTNPNPERTRRLLPQQRWTRTQASVVDDVLDEATSGHATEGTVGAAIAATTAIQAKTDNLPADPASEATVTAASSVIDASKELIDKLTSTLQVDGVKYRFTAEALAEAGVANVLSQTTAIKAKTDNLPAYPASEATVSSLVSTLSAVSTAVAGIAAAVWSYASRHLSSPAAAAAAADTTALVTRRRGDTWSIAFAALGNLTGCTVQFTAKTQRNQTDDQSRLLITAAAGLRRLNGAEATDASLAAIAITDAVTGAITITVDAEATADLVPTDLAYDIQVKTAGGVVSTPVEGTLTVTADVSRAV